MPKKKESSIKINLLHPDEIMDYLNQYVVGQEEAKRVLSVAVYNHYKRIIHEYKTPDDIPLGKANVLLLGETGSGKTLLVKTIAQMLGVPYHIQDCTKITASGYVGSDVEDCLVGLLRATNYDMERAEMGIVMLDEVDKIARVEGENRSITRDVSGECVQQSLLKIVEGDIVGLPPNGGRKHPEQSLLYMNTKNILFIATGAFNGVTEFAKKRLEGGKMRLCNSQDDGSNEEYVDCVIPQDLQKFGMIPEFVGRFPIITGVHKLAEKDLVAILKEPKNALIKQYQALISMDGGTLKFTDEALKEIAHLAFQLGTGARGLQNIVEMVMTDVMFEAPKRFSRIGRKTIEVTGKMVREKCSKRYKLAE